MGMADIRLTDIIDVETLQQIQDGFAKLTGMAALTTDADGNAVTRGSNFTDFCMNLTRKSKLGCERCEQCDKKGGEMTMKTRRPSTYYCHGGLVDFAAPIMLNGRMIGSFIGGQVLPEPPDEKKFRKIALELGINADEYIKAVRKVKIMPKEQIDDAADYLFTIATVLSKVAYGNYLAAQSNSGLSTLNHTMYTKIQNAQDVVSDSLRRMRQLSGSFEDLVKNSDACAYEVTKTSETVNEIRNIALNTKILGFNASIEASRAKEHGKGFGVIAQEVRVLAETSSHSADQISKTMKRIGDQSQEIAESVLSTQHIVNTCMEDLKEFAKLLNEIKTLSSE